MVLKNEISWTTMTCWLDYANQLLADNTVFSSFLLGDFTLIYCSMVTNYVRPWLETTMLHFGSLNPLKSFLPELHNTSHNISQRFLSLYINQIYPLIADICLCQDIQIYKMTVLALIFRNESYFPSVSKQKRWRLHKALYGLHVNYVWRLYLFHNHL